VPRIAVSLSGKEQYIEQTQIKQKPINLQCVSPLDIHIAVSTGQARGIFCKGAIGSNTF
jgi:hypothetical protein